jgi:hypothetical protein
MTLRALTLCLVLLVAGAGDFGLLAHHSDDYATLSLRYREQAQESIEAVSEATCGCPDWLPPTPLLPAENALDPYPPSVGRCLYDLKSLQR